MRQEVAVAQPLQWQRALLPGPFVRTLEAPADHLLLQTVSCNLAQRLSLPLYSVLCTAAQLPRLFLFWVVPDVTLGRSGACLYTALSA